MSEHKPKQEKKSAQNKSKQKQKPQSQNQQEAQALEPNQLAEIMQNPTQDNLTPDAVLQLQRTHGNHFVSSLAQQHTAPKTNAIQRLNVDETYFYEKVKTKMGAEFRQMPEYKSLVSNVRMYQLLAANPFRRADSRALQERLEAIFKFARQFDAELYKRRRTADLSKKQNVNFLDRLDDAVMTTIDDVRQEREAISTLMGDNAVADEMMSWKEALMITRAGKSPAAILTENNLAPGTNGNQAGNPENLTGGAISQVTALDFAQNNGGSKRRVFKPNEEKAGSPDFTIDKLNVQTLYRAMATANVQNLIRTKMEESGHEFQSLVGNFDIAQYDGKLGTVADFAEGKDAAKNIGANPERPDKIYFLNVDISDLKVQQQLANLQLFDVITGQIDRHIANMMIQQGKNKDTKVTGIDNDFTFSSDSDVGQVGKSTLPQKIDLYFAQAILAIQPGELMAQLKGIRKTDQDAAIKRLKGVQAVLKEKLANNELLVAPGDPNYPDAPSWGTVDVQTYRTSKFTTGTKDYAGEIASSRTSAYQAVKADPSLKPEKDEKGRWVLKYSDINYLQAREDDGSDLFKLVEDARKERLEENRAKWSAKPGRGRSGVTIGNRGRRGDLQIGKR